MTPHAKGWSGQSGPAGGKVAQGRSCQTWAAAADMPVASWVHSASPGSRAVLRPEGTAAVQVSLALPSRKLRGEWGSQTKQSPHKSGQNYRWGKGLQVKVPGPLRRIGREEAGGWSFEEEGGGGVAITSHPGQLASTQCAPSSLPNSVLRGDVCESL